MSQRSPSRTAATASLPNASCAAPDPRLLRSLVLNYLCHHCYTSTARAFARDSAVRQVDADDDELMSVDDSADAARDTPDLTEHDLLLIERRKDIRAHLLGGYVDEATELLNTHFPSVLSRSMTSDAEAAPTGNFRAVTTTMDPAKLSLNLRIQAFIEACRTVPLPGPSDSRHAYPMSPMSPTSIALPLSPVSTESYELQQQNLIKRAKKLHQQAKGIDDPDKETYKQELSNVSGLLAYGVPESSPVAKFLSMERREAVAAQINSAILFRTGHVPVSSAEMASRYTTVLWSFIQELRIQPLANGRPPDISGPPTLAAPMGLSRAIPGHKSALSAPEVRRIFALVQNALLKGGDQRTTGFDLREFLDSGS